jgi:hypothetical protein
VGWIALATVVAVAVAAVASSLCGATSACTRWPRRSLASTLGLRGRHGLRLLRLTLLIWAIEAGVWMAVGAPRASAWTRSRAATSSRWPASSR